MTQTANPREALGLLSDPTKKHDFFFLFDCTMGNPNGDPDADGAPRVDPETSHGIVTGEALKRKVRNYVQIASAHEADPDRRKELGIFIAHRAVLNETIREVYKDLGLPLGTKVEREVKGARVIDEVRALDARAALPEGFALSDGEQPTLSYAGELSYDELEAALAELQAAGDEEESAISLSPKTRELFDSMARAAGKVKRTQGDEEAARREMCRRYYDVRMFGAVMKTGLNAGRVLGPMQVSQALSLDPVSPIEQTVTRMAVTKEQDRQKEQTMGRKQIIPYGLFRATGSFSAHHAPDTGVGAEDVDLFWRALANMWEFDRSAARPQMATQLLGVFTHDSPMGNAPSHKLFQKIRVSLRQGVEVPRSFSDYELSLDTDALPPGVTFDQVV